MHFLLVDTADSRGCVALFRDQEVLKTEVHPGEQDYSHWLLPAVRRVLSGSPVSLSGLDGYAVCSGPGSFTGLRVGLTAVKAWATLYPKPIAAVSRIDALASWEPANRSCDGQLIGVYLDAKRDQVFAGFFEGTGSEVRPLEPEAVIALADFVACVAARSNSRPVLWRSPDPQLLRSLPDWPACEAKGDRLEAIQPPFAIHLGVAAYNKFLRGDITDAAALDATYVRRSDAELFWKDQASPVKA